MKVTGGACIKDAQGLYQPLKIIAEPATPKSPPKKASQFSMPTPSITPKFLKSNQSLN
jgi:hypothetical protein